MRGAVLGTDGHIRQIHIAPLGTLIPSEHRVDSLSIFYLLRLVDTARVYPDVFQPVMCSLLATEAQLLVPRLALPRVVYYIVIRHLIVLALTPRVREDIVPRDMVIAEALKAEAIATVALEEVHAGKQGELPAASCIGVIAVRISKYGST